MIAHCVSVNVMRIKATSHLVTLNHSATDLGNLKRQQTLAQRRGGGLSVFPGLAPVNAQGQERAMARASRSYTCAECGAVHPRWAGRCEACGAWNSLSETAPVPAGGVRAARPGGALSLGGLATGEAPPARRASGIGEFDRVLGGGLVPGAAVLVGGDPGIGKSTLLLQAAAGIGAGGGVAVYLTGEEAAAQVRMRAGRLGLSEAPVALAAATELSRILATLEADPPDLVVIDSIQTLWAEQVEAAPGSVTQLRAGAQALTQFAKRRGSAVVLVGHVTKEGQIAGPRVIEHMVDTVLYFEGERAHPYRILRAVKNRFGPADEIGVFEMTDAGLAEVANPSALFLGARGAPAPGSAVFAGIEGTRPVLTEIQALVAPSSLGTPRRTAVGLDGGRLATTLAVLESRCGLSFAGLDVFLNVAGGLRVGEPAADLAVAAALVSAREDVALPAEAVIFGEVSLSGALRPVTQTENRLKEARKLGFCEAILPADTTRPGGEMRVSTYADLPALVGEVFGAG